MCNDFRAKRTFFINFFRKNFGGIKKSSTFALANETSHLQNQNGALVQLVRMPACHAGGRWFESCTHRKTRKQSRSRVFCFYPTDLPYQWKFRLRGKILGINYALLPNRQWNQKQKHKKQPWSNVECFAFGGAPVRFASLEKVSMPSTTQSLRHPLTRAIHVAPRIKTARRFTAKTP